MRLYFLRLFSLLALLTVCCGENPSLFGQEALPISNWRAARQVLERQFGDELQTIAQWSRDNGVPQQVEPTFNIYLNRDLGRQYIYMPSERSMPTGPDDARGVWLQKVNEAKVAHAERILELAKKASQQEQGAIAYQLLHEVIHYNLDHAQVRKMLGHVKSDEGWKVASDSLRVKQTSRSHDVVRWPAKSYIRVLTPHFEIESNASEERTKHLAAQLERAHYVWRQVFFEYWSSTRAVKGWIEGNGSARMGRKRFRVVFFKDKKSYVEKLEPIVRGIGVSSGYYSPDQEISFFYDGDQQEEATWRHELTHQLFRESGRAKKKPFENEFIWLDEGIATYFESMTDFGSYVTLGGFDSSRMQYARIRWTLEKYHINLSQLSTIGRKDLQQRDDMARLYGQAAGLTDMLMNSENGAYEKKVTEFLKLIFKARVKKGAFEKIIGLSFDEMDAKYKQHLTVDTKQLEQYLSKPEERTELSLPDANLNGESFETIGKCINLNWIDLSQNQVGALDLQKLRACVKLHQIILTECRFESDSLRGLELFPILDELDLSGSQVQDYQLANFGNLRKLRSLRLIATNITDQGLLHLAKVGTLQSLDVSRTRVTDQGVRNLKAALPNVEIKR